MRVSPVRGASRVVCWWRRHGRERRVLRTRGRELGRGRRVRGSRRRRRADHAQLVIHAGVDARHSHGLTHRRSRGGRHLRDERREFRRHRRADRQWQWQTFLEPKYILLLRPPEHNPSDAPPGPRVLLLRLLSEPEEQEEDHGGRGHGAPEQEHHAHIRAGQERGGELADALEVGMHGGPGLVRLEAARDVPVQVDRVERGAPDHLEQGHADQPEVSVGGQAGARVLEVCCEDEAPPEEVVEGYAWPQDLVVSMEVS
jgi:hypothetical protein